MMCRECKHKTLIGLRTYTTPHVVIELEEQYTCRRSLQEIKQYLID